MKETVVLWCEELLSLPAFPGSVFFGKARAELERALFLPWSLVREGRMVGIFVAVWLDSSSSRLLGTVHMERYSDAEAQP